MALPYGTHRAQCGEREDPHIRVTEVGAHATCAPGSSVLAVAEQRFVFDFEIIRAYGNW
jgi:hypothetical protein